MVADEQVSLERAQARIHSDGSSKLISWDELVQLIDAQDLAALTRTPTQLKDYFNWKAQVLKKYPGVEAFILQERLGWHRLPNEEIPAGRSHVLADGTLVSSQGFGIASTELFGDESDWRCLKNDFPYGFEDDITHLVVWLKHALPQDEQGVLHPDTQAQVDRFIYKSLCKDLPRDRIVCFFNPPSLKSIGSLEHFHLCLRNVDYRDYVTSLA